MSQLAFAQKAFIVSDGKVLLVRKAPTDPVNPGLWEVPGGRMEFGEDTDPHIIREVKEEVGIEVRPGRPFYLWQWRLPPRGRSNGRATTQIVAAARLCDPLSFELTFENRVAEDYLADARWVAFSDLLSYRMIPNMLPVIRAFLKEVGHEASDERAWDEEGAARRKRSAAQVEKVSPAR